jgi:hypothetical protein
MSTSGEPPLISCHYVFEKGNHIIPATGGFLRQEMPKTLRLQSFILTPHLRESFNSALSGK